MVGFLELLFGALVFICVAALLRLVVYLYSIWNYKPDPSTRVRVSRDYWESPTNPNLQVPPPIRAFVNQSASTSHGQPRLHTPRTRACSVAVEMDQPNEIRQVPRYTKRGSEASIRLTAAEPLLPSPTAPPYEEEPPPPYEEACRALVHLPKHRF